jgi:glucose/arabinose dehydrogenase
MPRLVSALVAVLVFASACGGGSTSTSAFAGIGQGLQGPSALSASVYATGLTHISAIAIDDQKRLWAATADYTDSGGDAVYVVAAKGGTSTKVIDGLHTPLGLLWLDQTLYVASKEKVETYTGFDGNAFTSHSTVLALPPNVGEVNGLVLAPDGRIQLGISAPCDHCTPTLEQSAAVISFARDGSDQRVDASGIRAPIGLAYYPGTEDLFVTMNQRDDLGDATPGDWLSIVRPGQSWGFPDCYGQGGTPCTNVPSPLAVLDQHAAVDGVAIVTGQLGSSVGNAAVVSEWATGKVLRVDLTKKGSSYAGTVTTLLTGMKNPVPVVLADGALYTGDWTTGTVYRITPR